MSLCLSMPTSFQTTRTRRGIFHTLAGLSNTGNGVNAGSLLTSIKDHDDEESAPSKPKPYFFNDMELTAIQAIVSLRDMIGVLLKRAGINIPASLASLITRSENAEKGAPASFLLPDSSGASSLANVKSNNMALLVRGLALSLPLLIPMATQIRRMSTDNVVPQFQLPQFPLMPDPYYDQALHRRRGKRSVNRMAMNMPVSSEQILHNMRLMEAKYGNKRK